MKKTILVVTLTFLLSACHKDNKPDSPSEDPLPDDALTIEQDSIIASIPDTVFTPDHLLLPNGMSMRDYAYAHDSSLMHNWGKKGIGAKPHGDATDPFNLFITKITSYASFLVNKDDPKFVFPDEGPGRAAQTGLAYIYDVSNQDNQWEKRYKSGDCDIYHHGLDCSSFVCRVLIEAGVIFSGGQKYTAEKLAAPALINGFLANTPEYSALSYEDKGKLDLTLVDAGDIMYFKNKKSKISHIGIVCKTDKGEKYIFQSNGTPDVGDNGCDKNTREYARGPRCVEISKFISYKGWSDYYVLKPKSIMVMSSSKGDGQQGNANELLGEPLEVQVMTTDNKPVPGIRIEWATAYGELIDVMTATDEFGLAHAGWRVGSEPEETVEVKAYLPDGREMAGSPILFTAYVSKTCEYTFTWGNPRGYISADYSGPAPVEKIYANKMNCDGTVETNGAWVGVKFNMQAGTQTLRVKVSNKPFCNVAVQDTTIERVFQCQ